MSVNNKKGDPISQQLMLTPEKEAISQISKSALSVHHSVKYSQRQMDKVSINT